MKGVYFVYPGPSPLLRGRQLLCQPLSVFHDQQLKIVNGRFSHAEWIISLSENLLFNAAGLLLIKKALGQYGGNASKINFSLKTDSSTFNHYYSLHSQPVVRHDIALPIVATRGIVSGRTESLLIDLPAEFHSIRYPQGLCSPSNITIPAGLLMEFGNEFDMLFANQIAVLNDLRFRVSKSPVTWLRTLWHHRSSSWKKRLALNYRSIHSTAKVHPTAVIEGATIGANSEVGAHCVVRHSLIGRNVKLQDGAKVEYSVVGNNSWLMHDLVLYRCAIEDQVFLIHGPYQFSYFQSESAAFASILMDYRPDARPIRVKTPQGLKEYGARFLGSVLKEKAKLLGGCLLAPGRIVPEGVWLGADPEDLHTVDNLDLTPGVALTARETQRRAYEPIND